MPTAGSILLASIPVLVSLYATKFKGQDEAVSFQNDPADLNLPTKKVYDFIIVGGGAAGCVLATRLSKHFTVLLLEAGSRPPPLVNVPGLTEEIYKLPEINYKFFTTPQKNFGLERNGIGENFVGKMLGGGGSHNHGGWERGHALDYDNWAKLTKDDSWKWENVAKYFEKIEKRPGHRGGRLDLIESSLSLITEIWLEAGQELGYKERDPMASQSVGFNRVLYSSLNGSRGSTYAAYLKPILKKRRKSLKILTYAVVSRVLIEHERAIGVEFEHHGVARAAYASKEVILSAGALLSPIILFKSGIGPKDQIKAARAESHVKDLPVGQNLQDHTHTKIEPIIVNNPSLSWSLEKNLSFGDIAKFILHKKGPLTTTEHSAEAFIVSETMAASKDNENWPDLKITFHPFGSDPSSVVGVISHYRPQSSGLLTINVSALELPVLNFKYFEHPDDFKAVIDGIHFLLKVIEGTNSFKKIGAHLGTKSYGPCQKQKFRSNEYWKCYIRHTSYSVNHVTGTCRMGHGPSDPMAVVDSKLKVIGVKKLRVVDASIMPMVTNGNTYAPTVLIAEKAAHDILREHGTKKFFK